MVYARRVDVDQEFQVTAQWRVVAHNPVVSSLNQANHMASMAACCCSERDRKAKERADWVWKVSKTQVHKRGCIWSAPNTSLGIQWPLYKSWLSLLYTASDGSAKRLWDLWQHPKSFREPTTPVVTCCVTALWPIQRFFGCRKFQPNFGDVGIHPPLLSCLHKCSAKITVLKLC